MSAPSQSGGQPPAQLRRGREKYVGKPVERVEDATLLAGRARYSDDMPVPNGTLHAAVLRSPHAHAEIRSVDVAAAEALPGVTRVLTGEDILDHTSPFLIVVKEPLDQWCLAVKRVRYVGEAVAVVIAEDRYIAEDALDLIAVDYSPLPAVIDPVAATKGDAPLVHVAAGTNVPSDREFNYGDPQQAFAQADRIVKLTTNYPRNSHTPLEGFVVAASFDPDENLYDVLSNFQGPFTVHPVMARALRVPGSHLRMRTAPHSGGAFGVKQAIFPYVVMCCVASKLTGRPIKWVEDRLEHLTAATAAPNRVVEVRAAVKKDGRILALDYAQLDDYGAYFRPPMPGPLYRQHGVMTGPYDIPNIRIRNRAVMTNKTPSGMVRGFGGPQAFFALERLMHRIAIELSLDPLEVIRKNLVTTSQFPYRAAAGALLDSGNYQEVVEKAVRDGGLEELYRRRERARSEGRLYGIGLAACSDPAHSNMGYLSTIQSVAERHRSGLKGGNISYATVNVEPLGAVSVTCDSLPQGQGHATVLSQIVADELGLPIEKIKVNPEHDTHKDAWSIATGNYSCRFSSASAVAAQRAARAVRGKLARIAQQELNVPLQEIEFADGLIFARDNPENALKFHRVAGRAHWQPGELPEGMESGVRETATFMPPELAPPNDQDQINTSLTYGFVFDFCGVEINRDTGQVRIDKYVTSHDSGNILNPLIHQGQIYGAFAWAVGCALMEEFVYGDDGRFLSGSFADYLTPTVHDVPVPQVCHTATPTPFTELGAKGGAEGNVMTTPVCLANAVCDALAIEHIDLPLTPAKISRHLHGEEPPAPARDAEAVAPSTDRSAGRGRALTGSGRTRLAAEPRRIWDMLIDPQWLARIVPGCKELRLVGDNKYEGVVTMGAGPVKGEFKATVSLSELDPPSSLVLAGGLNGPLGVSKGQGKIRLEPDGGQTVLSYTYEVEISGRVAAIGGRMIDGAARMLIRQFFAQLARQLQPAEARVGLWQRVLRGLGIVR
ncbi:MAG: molybdopterin-dependent oxidoreductase [Hyphomicrobiales bacterium]|nr:molybdopterin-dependent oxidoreductase [Hyphomicrobiales bacterium]